MVGRGNPRSLVSHFPSSYQIPTDTTLQGEFRPRRTTPDRKEPVRRSLTNSRFPRPTHVPYDRARARSTLPHRAMPLDRDPGRINAAGLRTPATTTARDIQESPTDPHGPGFVGGFIARLATISHQRFRGSHFGELQPLAGLPGCQDACRQSRTHGTILSPSTPISSLCDVCPLTQINCRR